MNQPTRQDIIEAHRALTNLSILASDTSTSSAIFNEKIVRDYLPPFPELTMAEIEWDDDLHYMAEAEQSILGKVVMLGPNGDGFINFCFLSRRETKYDAASPSTLTPTGKRYTLTEVQE